MSGKTSTPAVAAEPAAAAPPRGKGRLLLVAGLALVVLGAAGAGGWWLFLRRAPAAPPAAEAKAEEEVRATVALGPIVVNLKGESRRYLRVAVSLGISNTKETKAIEERRPQLQDLLITVLSTAEVDALTSDEGRSELKETLLGRIHEEVALPAVARVYFTEFVIQ